MLGEHHSNLTKEFPEFKEAIHTLKISNSHFAKLIEQFEAVDKEIYRIETQIETPSDQYTEDKKKQRLLLKDKIYNMLKSA